MYDLLKSKPKVKPKKAKSKHKIWNLTAINLQQMNSKKYSNYAIKLVNT